MFLGSIESRAVAEGLLLGIPNPNAMALGINLVTAFGKRAVPVQLPRMLADICEMIQRSSTNRAPCSFLLATVRYYG